MPKPLLVMKFGGTSVGSPERIADAADIIASHAGTHRLVVVVSAMSKVTDALLDTLRHAEAGEAEAVDRLQRRDARRAADDAGAGRLGFFRVHSGGGARC